MKKNILYFVVGLLTYFMISTLIQLL